MQDVVLKAIGDAWLQTRNGRHPFEKVADIFREKDILFGNLETVLATEGERAKRHHVLAMPPESVRLLKDAGFDIVSVANNHSLDFGAAGFRTTLETLEKNGIASVGGAADLASPRSTILERKGITFGFLGYTIGRVQVPEGIRIHKVNEPEMLADIRALKGTVDHIVVSIHWGIELVFYPSPDQIRLAHRLIDAGATLILGHHPHTIQAIEPYHTGLIAYSLANFQFDPLWPHGITDETLVFSVRFDRNGIRGYEVIPVLIDGDFVPFPAVGERRAGILAHTERVTRPVVAGEITTARWFEDIAEPYLKMNLESYRLRIRKYGIRDFLECCIWLVTPFCLRCYAAMVRKKFKKIAHI